MRRWGKKSWDKTHIQLNLSLFADEERLSLELLDAVGRWTRLVVRVVIVEEGKVVKVILVEFKVGNGARPQG